MRSIAGRLIGFVLFMGLLPLAQAQIFGGNQGGNRGGFTVLKAEYGTNQNWTDVTERVRSLVRGDGVEFRVDGDSLTDPMPGVKKTLRIRYVYRGRTRTENFEDLAMVRLGQPSGGFGGGISQARPGNLRILKAEYGEGRRWRDVTQVVADQVNRNGLRMDVNNQSMGGDPAPAVRKSLRVDYEYEGRRQTVTVPEMSPLVLPEGTGTGAVYNPSSPRLEILEADYGAQGRKNNVTDIVRGAVQGETVRLSVNNSTMQGDPYPGPAKELYVRYRYEGVEYENFSREGSTLVLPNRYDRRAAGTRRNNRQ